MHNSQNKYEEEINIFTLLWFVVSKWKSILIVAIIGLILGAGYVVLSAPDANVENGSEDAIAEELSEYDVATQVYMAGEERVNTLKQYIMTSEVMNMNPYDICKGTVAYVIEGVQKDLVGVDAAIYSFVRDGKLYVELEKVAPYTTADIEQLVGLGQSGMDGAILDENALGQSYVRVSVTAQDMETLEPMMEQVEASMENLLYTLQTQQDIYGYTMISSEIKQGVSTTVAEYQSEIRKKYADEVDNLETYKADMESLEKTDDAMGETGTIDKSSLIKYGGVGFVGLAVLACILWILVYCFGGRLYAVSSIEDKYRVKVLGTICAMKNKNILDRWIAKKRCGIYATITAEEQRDIAVTNIKNELDKYENIKTIFITSTVDSGMKEAELLKEKLNAAGYVVELYRNAVSDAASLKKAAQCDAVIVCEHKADSNVKAVETEVSVLREYANGKMGMIIVGNGF